MNITIDTESAKTAALGAAKLSGVKQAAQEQSQPQEQELQVRKYDTVELSDEATEYLSSEETAQSTSEVSADSDQISASDLYSYTDDELDDLLAKGEITQLEYNTEMAKRSTDSAE